MAAAKKKAPAKTVKNKPAAKKSTATKTVAKSASKPSASKPKASTKAVTDAMTKTEMLTTLAENTELSKKQVAAVLDELSVIMERHLKKKAVGSFTLPGLMKIQVTRKPATKARKGVNPFTGEETVFKAKPARNVVKVRPLKKMKDMVN